jgi:hypothetical protein
MTTRRVFARVLGAIVVGAALGAGRHETQPSSDELLNAGDAAYARGDYAAAEGLFERAEARATDPGRVCLTLAAVKVRLGLETQTRRPLVEAEALYRCIDSGDPRRPEALFGLGVCLLHRAELRDGKAAPAAVEAFEEFLRGPIGPMTGDVRRNLERARLLALQLHGQEGEADAATDPTSNDQQPPRSTPESPGGEAESSAPGNRSADAARPAKPDAGQTPASTNETPAGEGKLPPLPEGDDAPPVPPQVAAEHLENAARRITAEVRRHRRSAPRPAAPGLPDW